MKTLKPEAYSHLPDGTTVLWISGSDLIWGDDAGKPLTFATVTAARTFMTENTLEYPTTPSKIGALAFLP